MAKVGRPEVYGQAIADEICAQVAQGKTLADICQDKNMPHPVSVVRWQRENHEFGLAYARARMDQADYFAEEIIKIAREMVKISDDENLDPASRRVRIDSRAKLMEQFRWTAAKLKPQSYGERLEAHLTGQIENRNLNVNVDVNSLTPAAREALRLALQPRVSALSAPAAAGEDDAED